MDNVEKIKYRKIARELININGDDLKEKNVHIYNHLISSNFYKKAEEIYIFLSMQGEVSTKEIIKDAIRRNKKVYIPKIVGLDMIFTDICATKLIKNKFGILEPDVISEVVPKKSSIIIVPGLMFDFNKNRLGRGKGYYDKYLKDKDILKVALCYSFQMENVIPHEEYDVKMDIIITERGIIK